MSKLKEYWGGTFGRQRDESSYQIVVLEELKLQNELDFEIRFTESPLYYSLFYYKLGQFQ